MLPKVLLKVFFLLLVVLFPRLGKSAAILVHKQNPKVTFYNINTTADRSSIKLTWNLNFHDITLANDSDARFFVHYHYKDIKGQPDKWVYLDNISTKANTYTISDLKPDTEYTVLIGIKYEQDGQTFREKSNEVTTRTKFPYGWFNLIVLVGSIGLFIHGMKTMSEGLQQMLGSKLRNQLGSIGNSKLKAVSAGFSITAIIQSVMVSLLMVVSMVNTGVISLTQSVGVILGSNIGTALTAWFINLMAFEIDLSSYALFILAFTAPFLFFGKNRWKPWTNSLFGFVFLIMGLGFMIGNLPSNVSNLPLVNWIHQLNNWLFVGALVFIVVGILITVILQSAIASMALTMALIYTDILPIDAAMCVLLGVNLGTALNLEYASRNGNVFAKRAARVHTLIQFIGCAWVLLLFPFIVQFIIKLMVELGVGNPFVRPEIHGNTALAIFYTLYSVLNAVSLSFLSPQLVHLTEKMILSKGREDEKFHLEYIGEGLLNTADVSILEAKKQIAKFGKITARMSGMVHSLLYERERVDFDTTIARIKKYEKITDNMEREVVQYLNKISEGELLPQTAIRIRGMYSIVNDLERIGDIYYQMSVTIGRKMDEKIWFTPEHRSSLTLMFNQVDNALDIMLENLNAHHDQVDINRASDAESAINDLRNDLRKSYLESLSDLDANFKAGMIYNDLFSSLEKVGDHVINVTEAIIGKV